MGDLNARTGERTDWVQMDSLSPYLPVDYTVDYNVGKRTSMDHVVNKAGLILLDTCVASGLRILNGRHSGDKDIGRYTCINSRGSSVVDYVLAEINLFNIIKNFEVSGPELYSDHCLLSFVIPVEIANH